MSKQVTKKNGRLTIVDNYPRLLTDIKQRIRTAQVRTAMAGNAGLLMLYWEIGGVLAARQNTEGWGAAVLPSLAIFCGGPGYVVPTPPAAWNNG